MEKLALYDITKNFQKNVESGPLFDDEIPELIIPPQTFWAKLFDYPIASRVGIAACPVTATAQGVELMSNLGYHIITFKTIRSYAHPAHDVPNLTPVVIDHFLTKKEINASWYAIDTCPPGWCSWSNSIGNASPVLEKSIKEIIKAKSKIQSGQLLIVSIFGTGDSSQQVVNDFVLLAQEVENAGADVIELNASCPNVTGVGLYQDADLLYRVVHTVTKAVKVPVVVKVGVSGERATILRTIARAGGAGITGINTVPARVISKEDKPFFGEKRVISGISGDPIRLLAVEWLREVVALNKKEKYNLTVLATGGITHPDHFDLFLNEGADVALTATGAMRYPLLAYEYQSNANIEGRYEPKNKEI